jgi:preprotein translocase subunit YajC
MASHQETMATERKSTQKAVITVIIVVVLTALIAYFLHLRPAQEAPTLPDDQQLQEEVQTEARQ